MSEIVTLELPDTFIQRAKAAAQQTGRPLEEVLVEWLERGAAASDDAAWEEAVLTESLGNAIRADGSIDFDRLRARGTVMALDDLL